MITSASGTRCNRAVRPLPTSCWPAVTQKLSSEIAPKFSDRAGGYTRIIQAGNRIGDNAKVAILELVGLRIQAQGKERKPKKEEAAEVKS